MDFYGYNPNPMQDIYNLLCTSLFCIIYLPLFIIWVWMLIDIVKREFSNQNDRLVWTIVLCTTNVIGGLLYFFIIRKPVNIQVNTNQTPIPSKSVNQTETVQDVETQNSAKVEKRGRKKKSDQGGS